MDSPLLYDLKKATELVGFDSVWTTRKLIWAGKLEAIQFKEHGKQYVTAEALRRLIRDHKRE